MVHVTYYLVCKNFGFCTLNNNSQYFDVDTMEVQVELISKSMFTLVQLTLVQLTPGTTHPGTAHLGTAHLATAHPGTAHPGTAHLGIEIGRAHV